MICCVCVLLIYFSLIPVLSVVLVVVKLPEGYVKGEKAEVSGPLNGHEEFFVFLLTQAGLAVAEDVACVRRNELLQELKITMVQNEIFVSANGTRASGRNYAGSNAKFSCFLRLKVTLEVSAVLHPNWIAAVRGLVRFTQQIADARLHGNYFRSIDVRTRALFFLLVVCGLFFLRLAVFYTGNCNISDSLTAY